MAANYPSALPVKDTAGANLASNPHSSLHNNTYDEIVALATELGTLPKGSAASVKARLDAMAWGKVIHSITEADTDSIGGSLTDLNNLSATWTAVAGRLYKITVHTVLEPQLATLVAVAITDSSNAILSDLYVWPNGGALAVEVTGVVSGLSGSVTYKARASIFASTIHHRPGPTNPAWILVEDIGPA